MFQYATGRALAVKLNTKLKLDITGFAKEGHTKREFALGIFKITADLASSSEIQRLKYPGPIQRIINLFRHSSYFREKAFNFNPRFLELTNDVYLDGYWASEKYFRSVSNLIRKEYVLKDNRSRLNAKYMRLMQQSIAVSVHIRRSDYITIPEQRAHFFTCSPGYYRQAVALITRKVKGLFRFFVFSDDFSWAKRHLKLLPGETFFVTPDQDRRDYDDLWLMSQCQHHIIANSSFSWWGAWLNPHLQKIVIAPKKWFRNPATDTADLIPSEWLRI